MAKKEDKVEVEIKEPVNALGTYCNSSGQWAIYHLEFCSVTRNARVKEIEFCESRSECEHRLKILNVKNLTVFNSN